METKQDIRRQIAALRRACTDAWVDTASRQITQRISRHPLFREADTILAYMDYRHEVVTKYLIEEAWREKKRVAVPKCSGKEMTFYRIDTFDDVAEGFYGIREPVTGEVVDDARALMLMPGVAFDRKCNRVGYGGGFYDRYLENRPGIIRMALAFAFQVLDEVPSGPHDIRPSWIVTEKEILPKGHVCI